MAIMANHMFDKLVNEFDIPTGNMKDVGVCKTPCIIKDFVGIHVLYIPIKYQVISYMYKVDDEYQTRIFVDHGYTLIYEDEYSKQMKAYYTHHIRNTSPLREISDIAELLANRSPKVWAIQPNIVLGSLLVEKKLAQE